ncbi:MAG: hypothetical protein MZV63_37950 [Marinilabiliales bacterium]|nr:hypothetical protein [Marinilabiliales bacterium]
MFALIILFKHRVKVKKYFSNIEKKRLSWLFYLTIGFSVYIYSSYAYWILSDVFVLHMKFRFIDILALLLTIYVFGLGIFGYKQEGIFLDQEISIINKEIAMIKNPNIKGQGLPQTKKKI